MKVLFVCSEAAPFSKTGGLGDVAGSLPAALGGTGVDVSLFIPCYSRSGSTEYRHTGFGGGIMSGGRFIEYSVHEAGKGGVYMIVCPELFEREGIYGKGGREYADNPLRYSFFSRAVLETADAMGLTPDVVHAHDWQAALVPVYMKTLYREQFGSTPSLLTIHNLGYQGVYPPTVMDITGLPWDIYNPGVMEFYGQINFLKAGIVMADHVNTVSETYAMEIQEPEYGFGLDGVLRGLGDRLSGIVNGIEMGLWNPESDPVLPAQYSARDLSGKAACKKKFLNVAGLKGMDRPLAAVVSRLAHQKGIDLVASAAEGLMDMGFNVAVLGTGAPDLEESLATLAKENPQRFWLSNTYDEAASHLMYAASDVFIMPSRYEPCGLSQLIAMRYGSIPVAHATGGIVDTVADVPKGGSGTGFLFKGASADSLTGAMRRALNMYRNKPRWASLMQAAMSLDYSWHASAQKYAGLYSWAKSQGEG